MFFSDILRIRICEGKSEGTIDSREKQVKELSFRAAGEGALPQSSRAKLSPTDAYPSPCAHEGSHSSNVYKDRRWKPALS